MMKKINKLYEKRNLCCLYYNENDTESFLIGWIVGVAKEFFIIECVTSKGYHNGFACWLADSIIKIEENNKYIETINKLWNINNQKRIDMPIRDNACLSSIIEYIINNNRLCFIEICESTNLDSLGYIKGFDGEIVSIASVNADSGEIDGEASLDYSRISTITIGSEEQVKLEKLGKMDRETKKIKKRMF